ncbi:hypothetical protein GCM10028820_13950 [Tessaracoccus terricola]
MLVYGKGQFFAPHQDSEKHGDMLATLVVSLPSPHTGGELVVDDQGELKSYKGSHEDLELVAFYSDRRHEVLPVRSGTRVTLTFNLLLDQSSSEPATGPVEHAAGLLRSHFAGAGPDAGRGFESPLAFLLDHEYSQKSMRAGRLKGADAERTSLLRAAADAAGFECVLALAEVQETRESSSDYYPHEDFYDEEEIEAPVRGEALEDDGALLDGSIELTWWDDAELPGAIALSLSEQDVCAVSPPGC